MELAVCVSSPAFTWHFRSIEIRAPAAAAVAAGAAAAGHKPFEPHSSLTIGSYGSIKLLAWKEALGSERKSLDGLRRPSPRGGLPLLLGPSAWQPHTKGVPLLGRRAAQSWDMAIFSPGVQLSEW